MQNIFLILSSIVGLLSPIIGIRSILKGEFKPQRTTRLILLVLTSIFVASLYAQGDKSSIYLALLQWCGSISVFVLSLKYGMGGKDKLDFIVLGLAILAIVIWKVTDNPTLALYMSILADLIGLSPTLLKSFQFPETEEPKFYLSDVFAGFFSLLAVGSFVFSELVFPLYIFLINLLCVVLILVSRRLKGRAKSTWVINTYF